MFTRDILQKAAEEGSAEVSRAFSKLAGKEVEVTAAAAESVSYATIATHFEKMHEQSVIAYAQVIEGINGAAILIISREDTLMLVDLLSKKDVGTTGILMDIDRSAVKETLNILSNAYINALAKMTHITLLIGSPYMLPASHINEIFKKLQKAADGDTEQILLFKTKMNITEYKINAELHVVFDEKIGREFKAKETH